MSDENPTFREHLLGAVALVALLMLGSLAFLNLPTERVESACGRVVAVQGAQNEGPTMRWLTVQPATGNTMVAWAPPEFVAMPGDRVCWHSYKKRFMGTSQQVYSVKPPAK